MSRRVRWVQARSRSGELLVPVVAGARAPKGIEMRKVNINEATVDSPAAGRSESKFLIRKDIRFY